MHRDLLHLKCSNDTSKILLGFEHGSGTLACYYYNGSGLGMKTPQSTVVEGTWYIGIYSVKANCQNFYIEGGYQASQARTQAPTQNADNELWVGTNSAAYYSYSDMGDMGPVLFYNRHVGISAGSKAIHNAYVDYRVIRASTNRSWSST